MSLFGIATAPVRALSRAESAVGHAFLQAGRNAYKRDSAALSSFGRSIYSLVPSFPDDHYRNQLQRAEGGLPIDVQGLNDQQAQAVRNAAKNSRQGTTDRMLGGLFGGIGHAIGGGVKSAVGAVVSADKAIANTRAAQNIFGSLPGALYEADKQLAYPILSTGDALVHGRLPGRADAAMTLASVMPGPKGGRFEGQAGKPFISPTARDIMLQQMQKASVDSRLPTTARGEQVVNDLLAGDKNYYPGYAKDAQRQLAMSILKNDPYWLSDTNHSAPMAGQLSPSSVRRPEDLMNESVLGQAIDKSNRMNVGKIRAERDQVNTGVGQMRSWLDRLGLPTGMPGEAGLADAALYAQGQMGNQPIMRQMAERGQLRGRTISPEFLRLLMLRSIRGR